MWAKTYLIIRIGQEFLPDSQIRLTEIYFKFNIRSSMSNWLFNDYTDATSLMLVTNDLKTSPTSMRSKSKRKRHQFRLFNSGNWFEFGIILNDFFSSTIWSIQIKVWRTEVKNPKIPGIQPMHNSGLIKKKLESIIVRVPTVIDPWSNRPLFKSSNCAHWSFRNSATRFGVYLPPIMYAASGLLAVEYLEIRLNSA